MPLIGSEEWLWVELLSGIWSHVLRHRRFGGTYCPYLQGQRVSQASTEYSLCFILVSSLLDVHFDPENGGSTFPRNVASQKIVLFTLLQQSLSM
jgi:hypothetical protein